MMFLLQLWFINIACIKIDQKVNTPNGFTREKEAKSSDILMGGVRKCPNEWSGGQIHFGDFPYSRSVAVFLIGNQGQKINSLTSDSLTFTTNC